MLDSRLPTARYEQVLACGRLGSGEGSFENLVADLVRIPGLTPEMRPLHDLSALLALVRLIRQFDPDIVETHTAKAGTLGRMAAVLARRPARRPALVHTYHGHVLTGYFGPAVTTVYRTIERRLARVSDRLVCVSNATVNELVALGIAERARFRVVRLGLDLERFRVPDDDSVQALRAAFDAGPDAVVACYVGRLVPIKRLDVLVDAFALARERAPELRLAVVGDGPLRAELERRALHLGLSDTVIFTGFRSDLDVVVGATDIAVLASDNEGTPVALIEAAAGARCTVSTNVGGVPEVVGTDTGRLVGAGDAAAMADALVELAHDAPLRTRLGVAAQRRVDEHWSVQRLIDDVESLYAEVLEERRSAHA